MADTAFSFLPIDRRLALADGRDLPSAVQGTALDADLSGFTALTEALAGQYGEQRGAEELARRLNVIYDGLITQVHRYAGTVLGFAGDAFSAWFDGDDGLRAATCAQALQRWMAEHAATASGDLPPPRLKVALASGATRRFIVGDPAVQLIEGLAGALVDVLAAVGHEAQPGEILLAPSTAAALGDVATVDARGVLTALSETEADQPWPVPAEDPADVERVRPWLLGPVHDRLVAGQGDFVADLRPATAIFARIAGISFETDPDALDQLDRLVGGIQRILSRFGATLIQLTIGDKGSYLYAVVGAPVAHEDNSTRAVLAAVELRAFADADSSVEPLSIGIADGRLRAGAYGGAERRTYGVLGDTVNLAARLMQAAGPGEILATRGVQEGAGGGFNWSDPVELTVKGKAEPIPVAALADATAGDASRRATRPPSPAGDPMVGRVAELEALHRALARAETGSGQIVAVVAEAGLGKTRLVSEFVAGIADRPVRVHRAEFPSYAGASSYLGWQAIMPSLLGLPPLPVDAAVMAAALAAALGRVDPALVARAPVLGPVLGVSLPDTDLTRSLDGAVRKTALEATVVAWLRGSVRTPVVIVVEDCHWIDPLSEDLLAEIGRAIRDLPVLMVLTHRQRSEPEGGRLSVSGLGHATEISLSRLSDGEIQTLIEHRSERLGLPPTATDELRRLAERGDGNPFYVEELLDWIVERDRSADHATAEVPTTLQSLVLSRMDRLAEQPRALLRVASAVGRVFDTGLLAPVHPALGSPSDVDTAIGTLQHASFVDPVDVATARYGFRHAITQEVAYSTLIAETRSSLHGRIGRELEAQPDATTPLDLLAHHFSRSHDDDRHRRYGLASADAAQQRYANQAAVDGYRDVLPLLDDDATIDVLLKLGRSLSLLGRLDEAADAFVEAETKAADRQDDGRRATAVIEQGELDRKQGRYDEAEARFEQAGGWLEASEDKAGVAEVRHLQGTVAAQRGDTTLARQRYEASLALRRELGDRRGVSRALNGLGIVAEYDADLATAADRYAEALDILTELGDAWGVAALTNNTGYALLLQGRASEALPLFEQAVARQREIGDPSMLANFLSNLGDAARELGDLDTAIRSYEEALHLATDLDERWLLCYLFEDVAVLAARTGLAQAAVTLAAAGEHLRDAIGTPLPAESRQTLDERLAPARTALSLADANHAQNRGREMDLADVEDEALQTAQIIKSHLAR